MKSKAEWGFTAPASAVDLARVIRETKDAHPDKEAIRLTLNGQVFTLASRALAQRRSVESQAVGKLTLESKVSLFGKDIGVSTSVSAPFAFGNVGSDVLLFRGDRVSDLVGAVVAKVEVF